MGATPSVEIPGGGNVGYNVLTVRGLSGTSRLMSEAVGKEREGASPAFLSISSAEINLGKTWESTS